MKTHAAYVYSAILFALAGAQAGASKTGFAPSPANLAVDPMSEVTRPTPAKLATLDSPEARHLFPVSDEKGLLLSCVAPELDTNRETDDFKNCVLAPGRTLDDVMHSFVRGIHEEERQLRGEHHAANLEPGQEVEGNSSEK